MSERILWKMPNGEIAVMCLINPKGLEKALRETRRAVNKRPVRCLEGAVRLPDADVLPPDTLQHAWRADKDGRVVIDPTVPDPPKPRDLVAEVDALKAELAQVKGKLGATI